MNAKGTRMGAVRRGIVFLAFLGSTSLSSALERTMPEQLTVQPVRQNVFSQIGGSVYGLTFDGAGFLYVVQNGKTVFQVAPDGRASKFCELDGLYTWSLTLGPDGFLYAPAGDRLLKISPEGQVSLVLMDPGVKPMGVAFDGRGKTYVTSETKIFVLGADGKITLLVDGQGSTAHGIGLAGLLLDGPYLYAADYGSKKILRMEILPDGTSGPVETVFAVSGLKKAVKQADPDWREFAFTARPAWMTAGPHGEIYFALEEIGSLLELKAGAVRILSILNSFFVSTIALGGQGFENRVIYGTGFEDGCVHRVFLD